MTEDLHINLPRSFNWADSFSVESAACPLSPRYRNLSQQPSLRRRVSDPVTDEGEKENELTPEAGAAKQLESVFSPRPQKHNLPRSAGNGAGAQGAFYVEQLPKRRASAVSTEQIFSPRYASVRNSKSSFSPRHCFSPRYGSGHETRKFVFANATNERRARARSASDSAESDEVEYHENNFIFSPRPQRNVPLSKGETDSIPVTVLDLLKDREH